MVSPPSFMQASQASWCGSWFDTVHHHTCRGRASLPAFPYSPTSFPCPSRRLSQASAWCSAKRRQGGPASERQAQSRMLSEREAKSLFSSHSLAIVSLNTSDPCLQTVCPTLSHMQTTKKLPCSKALSPAQEQEEYFAIKLPHVSLHPYQCQ